MTSQINTTRIAVILLFVLTFTAIGWAAPAFYAAYMPADEIIEVNNYEPKDTTTGSEYHYVCFDRTANEDMAGDVVTELYLLDQNGDRIEIERDRQDVLFQQGDETVIMQRDLPENMKAGEYRYVVVATVEMANGRVDRQFTFESEPFTVSEGAPLEPSPPEDC